MDAIAWLTVIYVAVWFNVYSDDIKKEINKPTEQTQQEQKK